MSPHHPSENCQFCPMWQFHCQRSPFMMRGFPLSLVEFAHCVQEFLASFLSFLTAELSHAMVCHLFALKFHFIFIVFTIAWGSFIAQYITKFHCAMCKCLSCSPWINFQHINYRFSSPYSITIVAFNMLANPREYLLSFEALLYTLYFVMETFKSHITLWFLTFFQNIMKDSVFVKLSWTIQWNVEIRLL
jgi:hypothetical protein